MTTSSSTVLVVGTRLRGSPDCDNMPLAAEPASVIRELDAVRRQFAALSSRVR